MWKLKNNIKQEYQKKEIASSFGSDFLPLFKICKFGIAFCKNDVYFTNIPTVILALKHDQLHELLH